MVRARKSAPSEVSAKAPVSVLREVIPPIRKKAIDPRFDRNFGHFNEDLFSKTFNFISDLQKDEHQMLKSSLRTEKDLERRESIKRTLNRIDSMKKTKELKKVQKDLLREHRKMDSKLVAEEDLKKLQLVEEFEKIKKRANTNVDVDKLIEKKRKRKASKQRRFMPDLSTTERE